MKTLNIHDDVISLVIGLELFETSLKNWAFYTLEMADAASAGQRAELGEIEEDRSMQKRKRQKVCLIYSFLCEAGRGEEISTKNLSARKKAEVLVYLNENRSRIFSIFKFCDLVSFFYKKGQVIVCFNNPFYVWCSIQKFGGNYQHFHLHNATIYSYKRFRTHLVRTSYNKRKFGVSFS